jgi:tetratricopeptide (TPR) repeat protein
MCSQRRLLIFYWRSKQGEHRVVSNRRGKRSRKGMVPLVSWALSLALASMAVRAHAEQDQRRQQARRAFEQGRAHYDQRRYLKAIKAFERAYELQAHFTVICTIARCYEELNEFVKAKTHYERCLAEGANDAPMAHEIRKSLADVASQLTWLSIESPGAGGTVYLDGQRIGAAPMRLAVNPGTHSVEIRRRGADPARESLTTLGGEQHTLTLVPRARRPPTAQATAEARSIPPSADTSRNSDGFSPWWFWGGALLTASLTALATVFSAQTLSRRSSYRENPTEAAYEAFTSRRLLANIFWAATVAAGASTTVLYFYTSFAPKPQTDQGGVRTHTFGLGLSTRF